MTQKTILVTGGLGFVGSHIVKKLIDNNYKPIILDMLTEPELSKIMKLRFRASDKPYIETCDITNIDTISEFFATYDINAIIHTAAITFVPYAIEHPVKTYTTNVNGTFNLLELSRRYKIKKFLYLSSASAYGDLQYSPCDERHPLNAKDIYGATKACADILTLSYNRTYNLPTTVIRTEAVYGPGDLEARVIPNFIKAALSGSPIKIEGDGTKKRDFTYVKDLANGIFLALENPDSIGKAFNITGDCEYSLSKLADIISILIQGTQIEHTESRKVEANKGKLDITKARRILKYKPETALYDGIEEIIKWYKEAKI